MMGFMVAAVMVVVKVEEKRVLVVSSVVAEMDGVGKAKEKMMFGSNCQRVANCHANHLKRDGDLSLCDGEFKPYGLVKKCSLLIEWNSYELNNQVKVWLSKEVGTGDEFAQEMGDQCYSLKKEMDERDLLIAELEKLAVGSGASKYVQILRRRQDRDAVKLRMLKDLLRHARAETHQRQLELDDVDYN
ncbi:hypothetical protein Tco_0412160 [Tanacetum coccineum]